MTETIHNILFRTVNISVLSQILFFNEWQQPDDFLSITTKERKELIKKYRTLSEAPSESNYWIWFGQYAHPRYTPRQSNKTIVHLLYEALIAPLPPGRLVSTFIETKSDVNPYKYFQVGDKALMYQAAGVNPQLFVKEQEKLLNIKSEINEYFSVGGFDTKAKLRVLLQSKEHPLYLINQALEESTLPFIG